MIRLTKGTKEIVPVTVYDATGTVTDLSGASPKFDLLKDDNSTVYLNQTATASGMRIDCLIDISAGGPSGLIAAETHLRLFVEFVIGSEAPRQGPVDIIVKDLSS
jgi:hypothetical protein